MFVYEKFYRGYASGAWFNFNCYAVDGFALTPNNTTLRVFYLINLCFSLKGINVILERCLNRLQRARSPLRYKNVFE